MIVTVGCIATSTAAADAAKKPPTPSKAQVEAAKAAAKEKAGDVAAIQAQLTVATTRLRSAAEKAGAAAEAYNGAMYRLAEAQQATAAAKQAAADARAQVDSQRAGVARLVTQNQFGASGLTGVQAFLDESGPTGLMTRMGAMSSAADSLQARYDQYTALAALADVAEAKAKKAEKAQDKLAARAAELRDEASAAANDAQSQAAGLAGQRRTLLTELADAQKISVELATQRQKSLEARAKQKAAEAAALQAALDAKNQTEDLKDQAELTEDQLANTPEGGWDYPGLPMPAGTTKGAAKAINFARAQLGEPYLWAAAGPDKWDCSGLTMMAWRQGGVSLPHWSVAQYRQSKHLKVGDLRPGDLVFWGTSPDTIHHVALYLGNNQILHAPRTGTYVRVEGMYDWQPPNFFGRP